MDLKQLFQSASDHLRAEFKKSSQITHKGEKGAKREAILRSTLRSVLPTRYGLGSGEVVTVRNEVSKQSDLIIFDSERGLQLLHDEAHGLYPIESVYGTIAVKSDLTRAKLQEAYENIGSVKRLVTPAWRHLFRSG